MIARWLRRGAEGAQLLGALLLAGASLRLMTVAVAWARLGDDSSDTRARAAAPPPRRPRPAPATSRAEAALVSASPAEPVGEPVRLMVAVMAGPARSEIYLNGVRLGLSPYVGDIACKRGERLTVEILPQAKPLMVRHGTCNGKTLRIDD